jgi:antitoxin MazE
VVTAIPVGVAIVVPDMVESSPINPRTPWHSWILYDIHVFMYIFEAQMRVAKWGNSLAVRLPATVVEALDLKPGDNIDIHVRGDRSFAIEKAPGARDLLARIRKYRGRLPSDFKFDRVVANERG